jgi:hypothetical protein
MENEAAMTSEELQDFVTKEMKAGTSRGVISQKLVQRGLESGEAARIVESLHEHIRQALKEEDLAASHLLPALGAGALAALVGGLLWALIVAITEYEIGYLAWGIGLLSGFAVMFAARGRKGLPLQVIAVVSSIAGIVIGKYGTFFYWVRESVREEYGAEAAADISVFSAYTIQVFLQEIGSMVNGFDALWVFLAVATAWKIPKGLGIKTGQ